MHQLRFVASPPEALFAVAGLSQDGEEVGARMALGPWANGPHGALAVGALGVLVDEVVGYALQASMPQGAWSISTEIWIDVVGPLPGPGDVLTARGAPVQAGSFATGHVCDSTGRVVAECRQRGRAVSADGVATDELPLGAAPSASPDLASLLGLRAEGEVHVLDAAPALLNPRGMLHGGVSLAASEVVATHSRRQSGSALPTSSVHIVHTRGIAEGASLELRTETRHAGRTLWVTEVIGTVDGRTCTVATITAQ